MKLKFESRKTDLETALQKEKLYNCVMVSGSWNEIASWIVADLQLPGLYAAGVITNGWESEACCSDLSGSAFGYPINSESISGENVAVFTQTKFKS